MEMRINLERLHEDLRALGEIGRSEEDGGLYRMAFTCADMEGKAWFEARMREAGLKTERDGAANVSGTLKGRNPDAPRIVVGSHLDTVPCAGTLDGALGVLTGLECLRTLKENDFTPRMPLELIAFSDEEGRFGGMLGSQAVAGMINPGVLRQATDLDGVKLSEAMESHGLDPWLALEAQRDPETIGAYLELHIEQGPVLDRSGEQVGVVEAITGLLKWRVTLRGEANHAGTTPMDMRCDAFMGLADFAHEIPRILAEIGSEGSRATIGRADLSPGSANTVPGEAQFSLDVRDTDSEVLAELATSLRRALSAIARKRGLMFEFEVESEIAPVQCQPALVSLLEKKRAELGLKGRVMPSGAAHDAQIIAAIAPVAMIFVPSRGGKSHSPEEWSALGDIEAGGNLMLQALLELAG
jgi:N-carbamoyl-L-amino-acid hydrolase